MAKNTKETSPAIAKLAATVLSNPLATATEKKLAASLIAQANKIRDLKAKLNK